MLPRSKPGVPVTEKAETDFTAELKPAGFGLTVRRQFIREAKQQRELAATKRRLSMS